MKKRLYSFTILFSLCILLICIFTKSSALLDIVNFSVNLFINNIFPSLFPMFVIGGILVEIDIPRVLGNVFKKPMHFLFNCKGEGSFIFFMSMITGFPSSAKYIDDLMKKGILSRSDSEKILMFTFFSNPLFIVNTVGNCFFGSTYIGFIMFISLVLGNLLVGIIFRSFNKSIVISDNLNMSNLRYLNYKINEVNIFKVLVKSIRNSIEILLNVFGIITFFLIVINIIFKDPSNNFSIIFTGITEMTSGLKYVSISDLEVNIKIILSMLFLSFGGFSVHFQMFSILNKRKVRYLPFLIARVIQAIFSILIVFIILDLFL